MDYPRPGRRVLVNHHAAIIRMLVNNELNRYKVGTGTEGLIEDKNGSITISLSHNKSSTPNANWLPAHDGIFRLFHTYQPKDAVMNNDWKLPLVTKLTDSR